VSEHSYTWAVVSRWRELSRETEILLRRNEELIARRVALYHRHVDLFRDFVTTVQLFVDDVGTSADRLKKKQRQLDWTSTGTVESSRRSR
jgi:hypothetical protein